MITEHLQPVEACKVDICECKPGQPVRLLLQARSSVAIRIPNNGGMVQHSQTEGDLQLSTSSSHDDDRKSKIEQIKCGFCVRTFTWD